MGETTTGEYSRSLAEQIKKIDSPENTPSARILNDMREQSIPFFRFAMNQAISHQESFKAEPLTTEEIADFNSMSAQSVKDQLALESEDEVSFDEYLANLQSEYEQPLS